MLSAGLVLGTGDNREKGSKLPALTQLEFRETWICTNIVSNFFCDFKQVT